MGVLEKIKAKGRTPRAVAYARFSSDNQREESIDAQLRAMRDYAQKNGISIVGEYIDRARSATTDDRPDFLKMVKESAGGTFDIVLVHKLDRFARNRKDSIGYRMELKRNGVSLISILEYLDDDSPESVILESVLEAMAEYYSKNLAREVRKGMKENALQCITTGGVPPFGYMLNPDTRKFEIDEYEGKAVRLIFRRMLEGHGYNKILRELNQLGYKTRKGQMFGKNSLYGILRNEKYKGVYVFNKASSKDVDGKRNSHKIKDNDEIIRIEGGIPAIVSEEDFNAVVALMKSRQNKSASMKAKETYMISGKIFCGECGNTFIGNRKFSGRNKRILVTYRCNTRARQTSDGCRNKEIRREYIERYVMDQIAATIFDDSIVPKLVKEYDEFSMQYTQEARERISKMKSKLSELTKKISNIVTVMTRSGSPALISALEKLELEKDQLEVEMEQEEQVLASSRLPEEKLRETFMLARQLFKSGELNETRQLLNLYLQKVVIFKEHVEVYINVLPTFCCDYHFKDFIRVLLAKGSKQRQKPTLPNRYFPNLTLCVSTIGTKELIATYSRIVSKITSNVS